MSRSKPVTLFIIRHGERVDHVDSTWPATAPFPHDPPLTQRGYEQAIRTGKQIHSHLSEKIFSAKEASQSVFLLSSPLLRCLQTSQGILAGLGKLGSLVNIRTDFGLSEWLSVDYFQRQLESDDLRFCQSSIADDEGNFSDDEYSKTKQLNQLTNPNHVPFISKLPSFPESYSDMLVRARNLIKQIDAWAQKLTTPTSPTLVLVTHGAMVNGLLEACLNTPFLTIVDNCAISCVKKQFTGAWQSTLLASNRHLATL